MCYLLTTFSMMSLRRGELLASTILELASLCIIGCSMSIFSLAPLILTVTDDTVNVDSSSRPGCTPVTHTASAKALRLGLP